MMPSYIFVRMRMEKELHFLISSLQYVVSFVGADLGGRTLSGQMQVHIPQFLTNLRPTYTLLAVGC